MLFRLQSYVHYYIGLVIIGHKTNRNETPPFIFLTSKNFLHVWEILMRLRRKADEGIACNHWSFAKVDIGIACNHQSFAKVDEGIARNHQSLAVVHDVVDCNHQSLAVMHDVVDCNH